MYNWCYLLWCISCEVLPGEEVICDLTVFRSVEQCIMASLNSQFPDVRVIGEEGQALQDDVDPDWIVTSQCSYVHSQVKFVFIHQPVFYLLYFEKSSHIFVCIWWKIKHNLHGNDIFQISELPEELQNVTADDVTVWVDPLDGTAEYTQGLLDHVTVLIGIHPVNLQLLIFNPNPYNYIN